MLRFGSNSQSLGVTILRVVTGIIFFVHGWQKVGMGVPGVTGFMTSLGIPLPGVAAVLLIAAELLGGLALILGLGTRFVAIALAFDMLVALITVHLKGGFFIAPNNGYEFVLMLLAANVALFFTGSGAYALDQFVPARFGGTRTTSRV